MLAAPSLTSVLLLVEPPSTNSVVTSLFVDVVFFPPFIVTVVVVFVVFLTRRPVLNKVENALLKMLILVLSLSCENEPPLSSVNSSTLVCTFVAVFPSDPVASAIVRKMCVLKTRIFNFLAKAYRILANLSF